MIPSVGTLSKLDPKGVEEGRGPAGRPDNAGFTHEFSTVTVITVNGLNLARNKVFSFNSEVVFSSGGSQSSRCYFLWLNEYTLLPISHVIRLHPGV